MSAVTCSLSRLGQLTIRLYQHPDASFHNFGARELCVCVEGGNEEVHDVEKEGKITTIRTASWCLVYSHILQAVMT